MTDHDFDRDYWEQHWATAGHHPADVPAHPYLPGETAQLPVGSALDAGCGTGAEARWLAQQGWRVTGADISSTALATAGDRAESQRLADHVEWVQADLMSWTPERTWDLVVTSYAHPAEGQLTFFHAISNWVSPGGTLLIVAHGPSESSHGHPAHAVATRAQIIDTFGEKSWRVDSSYDNVRTVGQGRHTSELFDVVVRLHRVA